MLDDEFSDVDLAVYLVTGTHNVDFLADFESAAEYAAYCYEALRALGFFGSAGCDVVEAGAEGLHFCDENCGGHEGA